METKDSNNDVLIAKIMDVVVKIGIVFIILLVQVIVVKYVWDAETEENRARVADVALDSAQTYIKALEDYVDEHGGLFDTVASGDEYSDYKDALASYNHYKSH